MFMNSDYNTIGLYEHNTESYTKVNEAYKEENIVGIVHATGTGKSYNALQLAFDNKDKKIIYVAPSNGIIEHIKEIIEENPNLDFERDFSHVEFRTYQSFINMSREELSNLEVDMLIVDEFHHIGAPVWGARIEDIIKTHPNIKVFGMTAYTVRDRGTNYERDMANPETNEIFSNKIVSRYDICDAMIDGVLPKPIYKSAYVKLEDTAEKLEEKLKKMDHNCKDYIECKKILSDIRKRIHEAPSISDVVKKNLKPNGKYIYFCPPNSQGGVNNIDNIMNEAKTWFLEMGLSEDDIVLYKTTSDMGLQGKENRNAFYNDRDLNGNSSDGKLRVMFAINQYNEGVHAPNLDGVIMGRGTSSDIVYFEQLGRALSVRGETKKKFEELEKYSIEELLSMCQKRDIFIKENTPKEEIIEKLIAPIIIDLTNNYEFIKQLENNLQDRVKEIQSKGLGNKRIIKINDYSFDIEMVNQELFETLRYVMDRLTLTWENKYELARAYFEKHGNLLIPNQFKTINGYEYDENGVSLGAWISTQRSNFKNLPKEKEKKLIDIGFVLNVKEEEWNNKYELAKIYFEKHGNLLIPQKFKTTNGYEFAENGVSLGVWISDQRSNFKNLSKEKQEKLINIGFILNAKEEEWNKNYELAKIYFERYGNLLIPINFKTINGYEFDSKGIALGIWISTQRSNFKNLSKEKQEKLIDIRFVLNVKEEEWNNKYELAKIYFEKHGNLLIPQKFKTINGYEFDENGVSLGVWISGQRQRFDALSKERQEKLLKIGFVTDIDEMEWDNKYELAKIYYEKYGNLLIPQNFKTTNGYEEDINGIDLGGWISTLRQRYENLSKEKQEKLHRIGFIVNKLSDQWNRNYILARAYYKKHGNLLIPISFITENGYEYNDKGISLGRWIQKQRRRFNELSKERQEKLMEIGFILNPLEEEWNNKYSLAKIYYEKHGNLLIPSDFRTFDGYHYDSDGITLGDWISIQRQKFKNLSKERQEKLMKIGFILNPLEEEWNNKYRLAKIYFEKHGNLSIPYDFKTTNGYELSEDGIQMGEWIYRQRKKFDELSKEKQEKLLKIGLVLNKKNNLEKLELICLENNINFDKNKNILSKIAIQEFISKINFLKENNVSLIKSDGQLHDIFSMASANMKVIYGFTLEEIIDTYYIKRIKEKGV